MALPVNGIDTYTRGSKFALSRYNFLQNRSATVSGVAAEGESPTDITNPDHSLTVSRNDAITFTFGAVSTAIDHIVISGHNAYNGSGGVNAGFVNILDGATLVQTFPILSNNNMYLYLGFPRTFANLIIQINNNLVTSGDNWHTVSYIAAGRTSFVYTGVQSGYDYLTMQNTTESKTQSNAYSAPVSSLRERKAKRGTLSFIMTDFDTSRFGDIVLLSERYPVALWEIDGRADSCVICFDCKFSFKAHGSSTRLWNANMTFNAFTGFQ